MRRSAVQSAAARLVALAAGWGAARGGAAADVAAIVADADARYARRDAGRIGARADAGEISEAISRYTRAAQDPASAEARWKLARSLYFLGTYTGQDESRQRAVFERARSAGEEAIAIVLSRKRAELSPSRAAGPSPAADLVRGDPDAAPSYFWTAVAWGQWALSSNRLEAARKGAASRIRDACLTVIALDPDFEEGGGYRILGRLHDQAPRIPLVTGWVSRPEGLRYLRLAVSTAPRNMVNRQFLAEALARAGRRVEAIELEEGILSDEPSGGHLVEELAIQEAARNFREAWRK